MSAHETGESTSALETGQISSQREAGVTARLESNDWAAARSLEGVVTLR